MASDDVLRTLLLPLRDGALEWPTAGALFLRARAGEAWSEALSDVSFESVLTGLVCTQTFKPARQALEHMGLACLDPDELGDAPAYPLVLLLPPRQRDEARALMARAVALTLPGGRVLACIANSEGARSGEADLARLTGAVGSLSKHKCRAFWSAPIGDTVDRALLETWRDLDAVRPVGDGRFLSRPGLFAWDRIDPATELLAKHLPLDLTGRVADLGAGHGVLTALMLAKCTRVKAVDLYEAEARALAVARLNLESEAERVTLDYHWHDVSAGLSRTYDAIVSNPPFHQIDRAALPEVGQRFITVAAAALRPGGALWLVANRHLPYEAVLKQRFGVVHTIAESGGFKVVQAIKTVRRRD